MFSCFPMLTNIYHAVRVRGNTNLIFPCKPDELYSRQIIITEWIVSHEYELFHHSKKRSGHQDGVGNAWTLLRRVHPRYLRSCHHRSAERSGEHDGECAIRGGIKPIKTYRGKGWSNPSPRLIEGLPIHNLGDIVLSYITLISTAEFTSFAFFNA